MNINLTLLEQLISFALLVLGVVIGPIVVNILAKERVDHVTRSTLFSIPLSLVMPLVLIQIYLLLKKDIKDERTESP